MNASIIPSCVFAAWALAVAICDLRSRRVPNALVIAGLVAALVAACWHAGPAHLGIGRASIAAAIGLAALMPFFVLGMMGGADVKVFAALGAWCGLQPLLWVWVAASLAALVHALAVIAMRARSHASASRRVQIVSVGARRGTPYATCLTLPALAWLALQWMPGAMQ
ncbi:Prepilin peptidase CpaA [Paraburkholderia tropica]|uniref:A24 family peptidase n=1 Tax=Paraburkholderia TaxID=1822464 RepID=UPI001CAA8B94|nr:MULTISPECIES: prepilin peptidase [Paraburkholderia]CAG9195297.1 Prepilin peptidase CpaA [Paraburkholderia tropica]